MIHNRYRDKRVSRTHSTTQQIVREVLGSPPHNLTDACMHACIPPSLSLEVPNLKGASNQLERMGKTGDQLSPCACRFG